MTPARRATIGWAGLARLAVVLVAILAAISAIVAGGILAASAVGSPVRVPWPLPIRLSAAALDDEDLRREVATGLLLLAGSAFACMGLVWRRLRVPVLAAIVCGAALGASHLDVLVVPAYPTSFYRSPTGFAASGIVRGADLYGRHCAGCHGVSGRGDGPAAKGLSVPPADLTAAHLWDHPDGELFWWLSHGIDDPDGAGLRMPGFGEVVGEDALWALIDFVRANNAGIALATAGRWPRPIKAPPLTASCQDGRKLGAPDLADRVVRLIVLGDRPSGRPPTAPDGVQDIVVSAGQAMPEGCRADDPDLLVALTILTGQSAAGLAGSEILIDPAGYLRARAGPDTAGRWFDTDSLSAEVEAICSRPVDPLRNAARHP